jgi:hypothetical protein
LFKVRQGELPVDSDALVWAMDSNCLWVIYVTGGLPEVISKVGRPAANFLWSSFVTRGLPLKIVMDCLL